MRRADEEAGEVPKAYVVVKTPTPAEDIMAFVAAKVAPHKRIRKLQFIDAIPKSASGKILRRVLIDQERAATRSRRPPDAVEGDLFAPGQRPSELDRLRAAE